MTLQRRACSTMLMHKNWVRNNFECDGTRAISTDTSLRSGLQPLMHPNHGKAAPAPPLGHDVPQGQHAQTYHPHPLGLDKVYSGWGKNLGPDHNITIACVLNGRPVPTTASTQNGYQEGDKPAKAFDTQPPSANSMIFRNFTPRDFELDHNN